VRARAFVASPVRALGGRQRGATLIVGLVLLSALTLLATSAMTTATVELVIADNARFRQQAFEAAESGIAIAMPSHASAAAPAQSFAVAFDDGSAAQAAVAFHAVTPVPDAAFSMGSNPGMLEARHFEIVSAGRAARGAAARHRQGFYVVAAAP
jgi:hypothetical protein